MNRGTFAERLSVALKARHMPQAQLARAVGVAITTVNRWIRRGDIPLPAYVKRVAEVLDVTPEWLLHGEGHGPNHDRFKEWPLSPVTITIVPLKSLSHKVSINSDKPVGRQVQLLMPTAIIGGLEHMTFAEVEADDLCADTIQPQTVLMILREALIPAYPIVAEMPDGTVDVGKATPKETTLLFAHVGHAPIEVPMENLIGSVVGQFQPGGVDEIQRHMREKGIGPAPPEETG